MKLLELSEVTLRKLHIEQGLTTREIGKLAGCSSRTVSYQLAKHGIPARSKTKDIPILGPASLTYLYESEGRSLEFIANLAGVAQSTVRARLRKAGIPIRPMGTKPHAVKPEPVVLHRLHHVDGMSTYRMAHQLGVTQSTIIRWMREAGVIPTPPGAKKRKARPAPTHEPRAQPEWEKPVLTDEMRVAWALVVRPRTQHPRLRDPQFLWSEYIEAGKSMPDIARELGVSSGTVRQALAAYSIPSRPVGSGNQHRGRTPMADEHREKLRQRGKARIGENNPNYRGGIRRYEKSLRNNSRSKEWALAVKRRDGWKCMGCGASKTDTDLHAHHIKPWRTHEELRWDVSNGITLCAECHEKAHGHEFATWAKRKKQPRSDP